MIRASVDSAQKLVFYSGGSMWPTFRPGDRLVLEDCKPAQLLPGEIVVFRGRNGAANVRMDSDDAADGARLIAHRVLSVLRREGEIWVRTQGDCSRRPDPEWPGDRLVGRVVEVSPVKGEPRKLGPRPFLGWRLRHRLSVRRIARGLRRRLAYAARRLGPVRRRTHP